MRHQRGNKKLNRPFDQRLALLRGQVSLLFLHGHVTTTKARAEQVKRLAEKLIAHAMSGTLHGTREVMKVLYTRDVYYALKHKVAPACHAKDKGGYLKEYKVGYRRGDGALLVKLAVPDFPVE